MVASVGLYITLIGQRSYIVVASVGLYITLIGQRSYIGAASMVLYSPYQSEVLYWGGLYGSL